MAVTSFFSCGGLKDVSKLKEKDVVLSVHKGPCGGKCSVYNIDVYKNRYAVYEGIANVEKYGIYAVKLSKEQMNELTSVFDANDFFGFDDNYPIESPDFPVITLKYNKENRSKTVTGSIHRPQKVLELQYALENLAKLPNLKLIKANAPTTVEGQPQANEVSQIIDNEIIVQLQPNISMRSWMEKYAKFQVRVVNKIQTTPPQWVIYFNKNLVDADGFLKILQNDKEVKNAEFNKKITHR